jgi:preprotein translocase SecF subunit
MFDIVGKRKWYFLISALIILPGIVGMIYSTAAYGTPVRVGIDFTGGTLFVLKFSEPVREEAIRDVFTQYGFNNPEVRGLGAAQENTWQIRTGYADAVTVADIQNSLAEQVAALDREGSSFDAVSPAVGGEVTRTAAVAIFVAAVVILGFIWWAFRRIPNAHRYGICAIVAMVHDLLVAVGVFSLLGIFLGWEADALFLTAVLTVTGFSVQDKIVVFDRIRENVPKRRGEPFSTVVNRSILETLHRSLATQLNAIFVMIAILFFGGASIKQFVAILIISILTGTYSSIFNAVTLLVAWEEGDFRQLFRRKKAAAAAA